MLTSWCVTGTSLLVSTGAVSYCYPAPMVKNLVDWWQILEVLQLQPQKNAQSNCIYVSVGIVGLSHVRTKQCTSTPSLRECWVFGSQLGIAIWYPGRFCQSRIPGLAALQCQDFGITKLVPIVLFRVLNDRNKNFGHLMNK